MSKVQDAEMCILVRALLTFEGQEQRTKAAINLVIVARR
jgi:hypothetical protein